MSEDAPYEDQGSIFGGLRLSKEDKAANNLNLLAGEEFEIRTSHIVYRQDILCRSVCGLPVYQLTISSSTPRP